MGLLGVVAYLTIAGTAPWIVGGGIIGGAALVLAQKARTPTSRLLLIVLAVLAFTFAVGAVLLLAASRACAGAGGCTH
jgi:hypothetical protein